MRHNKNSMGKSVLIIIVLVAILLQFNTASAASTNPLEVRFVISEPCGLSVFIETISGLPHNTEWLKDWYFKQAKNSDEDKKICDEFNKFFDKIENKYKFADGVGRELSLSQKLLCIAAECDTLDEFFKALKPILQVQDIEQIKRVYNHFAPFYRERIWQPRLVGLKTQRDEFEQSAQKCNMTEKLEQVRHFLKTDWPAKTPFILCLVPLPDEKKIGSHGESMGTTQVLELYPDYTFASQSDPAFHELCHALWVRSKNTKKAERDFAKTGGQRAFDELNESLATAFGTGWFRQTNFPNEKVDDNWYDNEIINSYAHGLAPLVVEYLDQNRSMDSKFAKKASQIFIETCPTAFREISSCHAINLYVDSATNEQSRELSLKVRKTLPYLRSLVSIRIGNGSELSSKKVSAESQSIVLISPLSLERLTRLSKKELALLRQQPSGSTIISRGKANIIFCVAKSFEDQEKMLLQILKGKTWPEPEKVSQF